MNDTAHTGDFLDHAVRKALGSDNALAPRLPSLYEPIAELGVGAGIDASTPEAEIGVEQTEMSPARRAAQPRVIISTAHASHVVQRNLRMSAPEPRAMPGQAPKIMPGDADGQARGEPTDAITPIPERFDNSPVAATYPRALLARAAPLPEAHLKLPARTPLAATAQTAAVLASDDAPLHPESPSPVVDMHDARRVDAEPQGLPTPRSPLMIAQPVALRPLPELSPRASRNPEPVIQVTIGRVEVRAMQQPATPRTPRSAPQPMRLDEYLNKRGGRQ